ncbi:hypothetical protein SAMN04487907_10570 [Zunongwangia mangrovi]|uniref:Lipoprotein n=1 Tax=Zunongwangia mangrovi TaxID=1334022 RepID=A0A1I1JTA5_9FLAO|nr:hypothetical protein [Zunongwangia mangrovi]SFC51877.1 hypothetical protein SAMN04487907_10570 [Zunongwangia mangrovi]
MKKLYSITLSLLFIFTSCSEFEHENLQNIEPTEKLYSKRFLEMQDQKLPIIDLDALDNYCDLRSILDANSCDGHLSTIKFKLENKQYHLVAFHACPDSREIRCYFRSNFISIYNDSIFEDYKTKFSIDHLDIKIDELVKDSQLSYNIDRPRKNLFFIDYPDSARISEVKITLKKLFEANEELESKIQKPLINSIIFDLNIPAPPPPPPVLPEL